VSCAEVVVTDPAEFVKVQLYVPTFAEVAPGISNVDDVAPVIATPLRYHWYVAVVVDDAAALKTTVDPDVMV